MPDKPIKCPQCNKTFATEADCVNHRVVKHGLKRPRPEVDDDTPDGAWLALADERGEVDW